MKIEVKLSQSFDPLPSVIVDIEDGQPFSVIKAFWPLRPVGPFSADYDLPTVLDPKDSFGFAYDSYEVFEPRSSWQSAWLKFQGKWGVHLYFHRESRQWHGQDRLITTLLIETPHINKKTGYRTYQGLGEGANQESFVVREWMPKYLIALVREAQVVQLEIEAWLEENS